LRFDAAMRKEGLTEVLTNDRHFEQEGFRALFRDLRKFAVGSGQIKRPRVRPFALALK